MKSLEDRTAQGQALRSQGGTSTISVNPFEGAEGRLMPNIRAIKCSEKIVPTFPWHNLNAP